MVSYIQGRTQANGEYLRPRGMRMGSAEGGGEELQILNLSPNIVKVINLEN